MSESKQDIWKELRKPFAKSAIGLLPKVSCSGCTQATKTARSAFDKHCDKHTMSKCADCGAYITSGHIHLDYVGHAAVTDRLNTVAGPENWDLTPMAVDEQGNPSRNSQGEFWCWLRIMDAKKMCVGDGSASSKELIGDALRNGAMRFGIALDLWSKEELESTLDQPDLKNEKPSEKSARPAVGTVKAAPLPLASDAQRKMIYAVMGKKGIGPDDMHDFLIEEVGVKDTKAMTKFEATKAIDFLMNMDGVQS